jgi:calcyclin binding protein
MEAIEREIQETETLLNSATFPTIKSILQTHLTKLQKQLAQLQAAAAAAESRGKSEATETPMEVCAAPEAKPTVFTEFIYQPIETYSWDQGSYNSPTVTVYVDLENVGSIKDQVDVSFTKASFDLTVKNLQGRNYRLLKDNLEKDIVPNQSSFVVKKNKVVIKLQKVKGEFSYDSWTALTAKKKREESESASKKDPMGGE